VPYADIMMTPLQIWLQELHLMDYEDYFYNLGFRLLEDFEELNDQDCYRYFPFLKVGDSRRLAKHCEVLDDVIMKKYKRKAKQLNKKNQEKAQQQQQQQVKKDKVDEGAMTSETVH
jgi:hypothetical protein